MSSSAIRVDGLGKRYRIRPRERYRLLSERMSRAFRRRPAESKRSDRSESIWALKDVTFAIEPGEVVGVIGRNGAGKSTLLKILSRITEPTEGRAVVRGRIGSLLEVGTGFHPELTGRENIFLNGAILGMLREEIRRKFDAIVAFAELDRFIDTPVKHYSSGMQMRLAFAVAAHLEPEILLVDEVLAVGDAAFQRKCMGKMDEVSRQGRTILFVSHQMNQLRRLCTKCLWLDGGKLIATGPTAAILNAYEQSLLNVSHAAATIRPHEKARFLRWHFTGAPETEHVLLTTGACTARFVFSLSAPIRSGHHGIGLYDVDGNLIWGAAADNLELPAGEHTFEYRFGTLPVKPGVYRWHVTLFSEGTLLESCSCVPELSVATVPTGHWRDECAGVLNLPFTMSVDARTGTDACVSVES